MANSRAFAWLASCVLTRSDKELKNPGVFPLPGSTQPAAARALRPAPARPAWASAPARAFKPFPGRPLIAVCCTKQRLKFRLAHGAARSAPLGAGNGPGTAPSRGLRRPLEDAPGGRLDLQIGPLFSAIIVVGGFKAGTVSGPRMPEARRSGTGQGGWLGPSPVAAAAWRQQSAPTFFKPRKLVRILCQLAQSLLAWLLWGRRTRGATGPMSRFLFAGPEDGGLWRHLARFLLVDRMSLPDGWPG